MAARFCGVVGRHEPQQVLVVVLVTRAAAAGDAEHRVGAGADDGEVRELGRERRVLVVDLVLAPSVAQAEPSQMVGDSRPAQGQAGRGSPGGGGAWPGWWSSPGGGAGRRRAGGGCRGEQRMEGRGLKEEGG